MRILFVCGGGYVYGKEIIVLSLLEGLRKRGHEVACLASTWNDGKFIGELERRAIRYERIPLGFISKTLSISAFRMTLEQATLIPRLLRDYRKFVREFRPDIVVHSSFHHLLALWPVLGGHRNVFHVHDYFSPTKFYCGVLWLIGLRVKRFIGVSKFISDSLVRAGVSGAKVGYVLNGISIDSPIGDRNGRRKNVRPLDSNGLVIGIVGQIGSWKGHDDFLAALRMLRESETPFQAKIFGNGDDSYIASLKERLKDWDLAESVHWSGFVADREEIFSSIDLCVVPSQFQDPCPTVAIEAASFGIPVVATRLGGLPEIIKNGETGYIVEPGSPQSLADHLRVLIENESLRHQMAHDSRKRSKTVLSESRMLDEIEIVFCNALL